MDAFPEDHRSGFVALVGKPNVGKSTLLNALLGFKLAIVTHKASTTRHRLLGILSEDHFQAVLVDTPGVILPKYELHQRMMEAVQLALSDADLVLLLAAPHEPYPEEAVLERIRNARKPTLLVLNKCDTADAVTLEARAAEIGALVPLVGHISVSATVGTHLAELQQAIAERLPLGPPYFPKDQLTDRTERFLVSELVREQVFLQFHEEIPYSTEVTILLFEEREDGTAYIEAEIHVARKSQKGMLIGKGGQAIKALGTAARAEIEAALGRPVFLQLYVRVAEDWQKRSGYLKTFGYQNP